MVDNIREGVTILLKQFMCDNTHDCGFMRDEEDACKYCRYHWDYDPKSYAEAEADTMLHLALEGFVDDDLKQDVIKLYTDKILKGR